MCVLLCVVVVWSAGGVCVLLCGLVGVMGGFVGWERREGRREGGRAGVGAGLAVDVRALNTLVKHPTS